MKKGWEIKQEIKKMKGERGSRKKAEIKGYMWSEEDPRKTRSRVQRDGRGSPRNIRSEEGIEHDK